MWPEVLDRGLLRKRLQSVIYRNWDELIRTLARGIAECLEKAGQLNVSGVSLHLVYLRTAVYREDSCYRIYLFDRDGYNGNPDCWSVWEMPAVAAEMDRRCMVASRKYGHDPRQQAFIEQRHAEGAALLYQVLAEMVPGLLAGARKELPQPLAVPVYFGEYMRRQQQLGPVPEEGGEDAVNG